MANKTKKRLVTGIACAVPAVIAVPSLLALTQCGGKTSTDHIKLSGDTKKEMSKPIFDEKITYEFLLENVDNPTTVQISLPNLSVNGKVVSEGKKLQMYTAQAKANGVVTIVFDRNKIIDAAQVSLNDTVPYEVKFDVNLKNDQFNETLSGFKLDIVNPKFKINQHLTHAKLTSVYDEAEFNKDYVATIEADDYYKLSDWDVKVTIDGKVVSLRDYEEGKYLSFNETTGVLTISGEVIVSDIDITFTAKAIEYDIDWEAGCMKDGVKMFNLPGLSTATHDKDVYSPVDWVQGGAQIKKTRVSYEKTPKKGDYVEITNYTFNNNELRIPADEVKGKLKIEVTEWDTETFDVTADETDYVKFNIPSEKPTFKKEYILPFDMKMQGHKFVDSTVLVNDKPLNKDCYEISTWENTAPAKKGYYQGQVKVKAEYVTGSLWFQDFNSEIVVHSVEQNNDKYGHIYFEKGSQSVEWGNKISANFKYAVDGQETIIQRGYALKTATVEVSHDDGISYEPVKEEYVTINHMSGIPTRTPDETASGITVSEEATKLTHDAKFRLSVESQRLDRDINVVKPALAKWDVDKVTGKGNVENEYEIHFTPNEGYDFDPKQLTVSQRSIKDAKGEHSIPLTAGDDYEINNDGTVLKLKSGHILDDIQITYGVVHHPYDVTMVDEETSKVDWKQSGSCDKLHAYIDQDYECLFKYDEAHYTLSRKVEMQNSKTKEWEALAEDEATGYTWEGEPGSGLYTLKIKEGIVKGNIRFTIKAEATEREVYFKEYDSPTYHEATGSTYSGKVDEKPTYERPGKVTLTAKAGYEFSKEHVPSVFVGSTLIKSEYIKDGWEVPTGEHQRVATLTIPNEIKNEQGEIIKIITDDVTIAHGADVSKYNVNVPEFGPSATTGFSAITINTGYGEEDLRASIEHGLEVEFYARDGYTIPTDEELNKVSITINGKTFDRSKYTFTVTGTGSGNSAKLIVQREKFTADILTADVNVSLTAVESTVTHKFIINTDKAKKTFETENPNINVPYKVTVEPLQYYELKDDARPSVQITYADDQKVTLEDGDYKWEGDKTQREFEVELTPDATHGGVKDVTADFKNGSTAIQRTVEGKDKDGLGRCTITKTSEKASYDDDAEVEITAIGQYSITDAVKPVIHLGSYTSSDTISIDGKLVTWKVTDGVGKLHIDHSKITNNLRITYVPTAKEYTVHVTSEFTKETARDVTKKYDQAAEIDFTVDGDQYPFYENKKSETARRPQISFKNATEEFVDVDYSWWSVTTDGTGKLTIPAGEEGIKKECWIKYTPTPIKYTITAAGDDHSELAEGKASDEGTYEDTKTYKFQINDTGYHFENDAAKDIEVKVGSTQITSGFTWSVSGSIGTLTINEHTIKGAVSIKSIASPNTGNTVTFDVSTSHCTKTSGADTATTDAEYTCEFTINDSSYVFDNNEVPVVSGALRDGWTPTALTHWSTSENGTKGKLTIPKNVIYGDITIAPKSIAKTFQYNTDKLNNCSISEVTKGPSIEGFTAKLTETTGYLLPNTVTVHTDAACSGANEIESSYDKETGILTVDANKITQDIYIKGEGTFSVGGVGSGCEVDFGDTTRIEPGKDFSVAITITAQSGYKWDANSSVKLYVGNLGKTETASGDNTWTWSLNNNIITINVKGDIVTNYIYIKATATPNT